jgi:hypothetical protein
MALRVRTVEYAFPFATASVASGTARDFANITVAVPETTSRTFRSVILEVTACDNVTTAASLTAVLLGISVSPTARNDQTVTQTITNSGENQSFIFMRDVTAYFQTNFTGTSHTVGARMTITGVATINCTAKLIITYEYDDTDQQTRIKTVKIPVDGNTGNLTTSLTALGGVSNQIPALDTFLPEASKVYRDIFFEINTHNGGTGTNSRIQTMRYNGTNSLASVAYQAALASDYWVRRIDKIITGQTGAINTSIANTVEAQTANADMPFPCLSGVLVVTYEYDHDETDTVINSIQIPAIDEAGWNGGPTSADKSRFKRTFFVAEPGPITLAQSGVLASYIDGAAVSMVFTVGDQDDRTFAHGATVRCGGMHHMRRFDSGAAGEPSGISLSRGLNEIQIDYYTTGTASGTLGSNVSALIFLNYYSAKCPLGTCAHAHTTYWLNRPWATTPRFVERSQYSPTTTPIIPEENWYSVSIGYEGKVLLSSTAVGSLAFSFQTEIQSEEREGAGWLDFYNSLYSSDPEIGPSILWARARDDYKRHPRDPETTRLDPTVTRDYRFDVSQNATTSWQATKLLTYHSITFEVSGEITGSNGGTVNLELIRTDTGEVVDKTTRTGNGSFTFTWYDNTINMIVLAYEDDNKKGASGQYLAGGVDSFDIDLAGTFSEATYYAYT